MAKVRVYELAKELGIEGKDMADKLEKLIDDTGMRKHLSANALKKAMNFSIENMYADYLKVYEAALPG